jgi:hypothetical protein
LERSNKKKYQNGGDMFCDRQGRPQHHSFKERPLESKQVWKTVSLDVQILNMMYLKDLKYTDPMGS